MDNETLKTDEKNKKSGNDGGKYEGWSLPALPSNPDPLGAQGRANAELYGFVIKDEFITSQFARYSIHEAMEKFKIDFKNEIVSELWTTTDIEDWLSKKEKLDPYFVFAAVCDFISRHVHFNPSFPHQNVVVTIYVLLTYLFMDFRTIAYLTLHGPSGSGKTKLLEILSDICFNGFMVTSPSVASLFRKIDAEFNTFCMDEAETLYNPGLNAALSEILNAGYRAGAKVSRCDSGADGNFQPVTFNVYGPKIIASIKTVNDVLLSRSIRISMIRSNKKIPSLDLLEYRTECQEIRNLCYRFALENANEIKQNFKGLDSPLTGRTMDLWDPMLAIAKLFTDKPIYDQLLEFAQQDAANKSDPEAEYEFEILYVIQDFIEGEGRLYKDGYYPVQKILEFYHERNPKEHLKAKTLYKILRSFNILTSDVLQKKRIKFGRVGQQISATALKLDVDTINHIISVYTK